MDYFEDLTYHIKYDMLETLICLCEFSYSTSIEQMILEVRWSPSSDVAYGMACLPELTTVLGRILHHNIEKSHK
jgi:hypothetical protein